MALSLSTVTKPAARALAMLPGSPWWWAAGAAAIAVLLGSRAAGAESGGSGSHPQPGGALPLLKSGASGPWVSFLQSLLAVPATGTFDAATLEAVKAVQSAKAPPPDGIVGPNTWKALGVKAQGGAPAPGGGSSPAPKPGGSSPTPGPAPVPTATNVFGLADGVDARESQILSFAGQGIVDPDLVPLSWERNGHSITAMVTRRALALQDSRGRLMFSMSFKGAQQLLDQLGLIMLTTRVADEAWNQGKRMTPTNQPWNTDSPVTGGKTGRMIEQSAKVETKVGGDGGLIANEGKDWVLTRRFWTPPAGTGVETPQGTKSSRHNSANFGLYMPGPGWSKSPGGENVIQSIGMAHERSFVDYCLAAGTLVDTPTGHVPIERLKAGDLVFSYNRATSRPDCSRVGATKATGIQPTMAVVLDNGERVRCTANHRWLMVDGSERLAADLRVGDRLLPLRRSRAGAGYETLYSRSSHAYVYTHRAVGCAAHGLPIDAAVLVHHVDENKRNNSPANLEILSDHQAHADEHGQSAVTRAQWTRPDVRERMSAGISRAMKGRPSWRKGQKEGPTIQCKGCNVDVQTKPSDPRIYCSRKCYTAARQGTADRNHRIASIERDGLAVSTFDIEVKRDHNFALAAGVFVHNSQLVRGIAPSVVVDGSTMSAADVLADPGLSYLLNDEGGTMPATRHPDL